MVLKKIINKKLFKRNEMEGKRKGDGAMENHGQTHLTVSSGQEICSRHGPSTNRISQGI